MKSHFENICNCGPQSQYECGGLDREVCPYFEAVKVADVALCASRHDIPEAVDGAIFDHEVDPTRPLRLEAEARHVIRESGVRFLTVYVTGLSVALVAVINACHALGVGLVLMHYDRETGGYYPQYVR